MEEEKKEPMNQAEATPQLDPTKPYLDPETGKWRNYHPQKGVKPPWDPFNPQNRKNRLTMNEKKFLYVLGKTGKLHEAYMAVYKVKDYGNPSLQRSRVQAMASQVLARLRRKAPELTQAATFDDISVDFVKKELLRLYHSDDASIHEKTRLLELMGKTQAMFTDKQVVDTKIREVVGQVYTESDEDFPSIDQRLNRLEIEEKIAKA